MKHLWKLLFLLPIIVLFQATYSGDLGVDSVDIIDKNTIKVTLSDNPNIKVGENEAEVTILNDVQIAAAVAKAGSMNEVEILLDGNLIPNTSYSLLTVAGAQGSIDFTTPSAVEGYTQANLESVAEQEIASIELIDAKNIVVKYVQNVSASGYDFKLLAESKVTKIEKPSYELPELLIHVEPPLISEQDYIIMFIDMKDVDGKQIEFDTGIYDFTTPLFPKETSPEVSGEELPELNAAGEAVSLEKETLGEETPLQDGQQQVEAIAATVTETPATGTATWILIALTIFINAFYFFTRRKAV